MKKIYAKAFLSGGEKYWPIFEMEEYIDACNSLGIAIIAVDFFKIKGKAVQPVEALSGFDASTLFDETLERTQNVTNCNSFILNCYEKSKNSLKGYHFTSVEEYR
jgi:hypothetical protein